MERFNELKEEILRRAHEAHACREEYGRAYKAETLDDLMQVVRDNFSWCTDNDVVDGALIDAYNEEFNVGKIWHNESSITEGFMLATGSASVKAYDSASVEAYGSASVEAYDSASVKAYDSASVEAYGSASVKAYDSASVEAYGSASVEAYDSASVKAYGSASVEAYGSASVKAYDSASVEAYDSASVEAYGSASVEAYGSAYVYSFIIKECKLHNHAIYRIVDLNEVRYADEAMKFVKVEEGRRNDKGTV